MRARSGGTLLNRLGGAVWFAVLIVCAAAVVVGVTVLPRSATPPPRQEHPVVVASLPFFNLRDGSVSVLRNQQMVSEVSPWMYGIGEDGHLIEQFPQQRAAEVDAHVAELRRARIPLVPSLANITNGIWSYEPLARTLHDPVLMRRHINEIVALVLRENYDGIDVDYENLRGSDRRVFTQFVTELGNALHSKNKRLSVALFAKESDAGYDERNAAQDYAVIGRVADQVRLMAYDYHWNTSPPGPVAPIEWVRNVLRYAKTQIPPERIILGIPLYGMDWAGGRGTSVTWLQALRLAVEHRAPTAYDAASQTPWFRYTDKQGQTHEVWFENATSSRAKLDAARGAGIGGVYLWMYGFEDTNTWNELRNSLPAWK